MERQTEFPRLVIAVILVLVSFPLLLYGNEVSGSAVIGIGLFFVGILLPLVKPNCK